MKTMKLAIPLCIALAYGSAPAMATSILGTELASFAVLGSSTVTNTGSTTLTGNLGVSAGSAITGFFAIDGGPGTYSGTAHQADAFAATAQTQLGTAKTSLSLMGPGTLASADLAGLTLSPGVYTVPAGASNLTGILTLDGGGNTNAAWVFQMSSTLITSSGSAVNLINSGDGAGVFWNVGSSATLGSTTSFLGNILAAASISMNSGATIACGRSLANTGAVTMISNTISIGCMDELSGSNGLSGGLTIVDGGTPEFLPFAPIPEPGTYAMMLAGLGLLGFIGRSRKQKEAA